MDNFDLRTFLAEGKLHEAMSPQDVVDIADTVAEEFTIESADEGEFLVYSVGKMDADDMSFELDTDVTSQTPKSIDTRGVGEGWGGIFRIKPTADGYEVRNAEKGGLVAMIDNAGNFKMLSADESRAELLGEPDVDYKNDEPDFNRYMEEGEITEDIDMIPAEKLFALIARDLQFSPLVQDGAMLSKEDAIEIMRHVIAIEGSDISAEAALGEYIASGDLNEEKENKPSNKMKKSELKEMIKMAMLAETSVEETLVDADQDMADAILNALGGEAAFEALVRAMSTDDAQTYLGAIMRDHDIEMGPVGDIPGFEGTMDALDSLSLREEEEDEEDVEVDAEEIDVNTDAETADAGEVEVKADAKVEMTGDTKDVQDNLEAALEAAKALGDQKLVDQIGNSITFFTRTHVVGKGEVAEADIDVNIDNPATDAEVGMKLEESVNRMKKLAGLIK